MKYVINITGQYNNYLHRYLHIAYQQPTNNVLAIADAMVYGCTFNQQHENKKNYQPGHRCHNYDDRQDVSGVIEIPE